LAQIERHLFQGLGVVIGEFYALPHVGGGMRSFYGLDIQVQDPCDSGETTKEGR
jgi:hypothetical protein